ncbi:hypothetical protein [Parasitella parasitica]|uniref:Uncharacterized protein n=1 Tax=Parasitella parasitica TaxID=35722 RepID=A0A0B7NCL2_9FUNG|nr:hypothetical protein [Parasitella parasitica]
MSSSSHNNTLSADDRLPVHNNTSKRLTETSPTIKKSASRNNINSGNFHLNLSSTTTSRGLSSNSKSSVDQPHKQLTVETVVFPEHQSNLFHTSNDHSSVLTKKSSSTPVIAPPNATATGDTRSIISGSESTRSISNKNNKRKKKANMASSFVNPTDIFAQNLSDAVMDADDSDDLESYVYRDKPNPSYAVLPWTYNNNGNDHSLDHSYYYDRHYSSTGTESNTDGCDYSNSREKFYSPRRPVLRSTVSEIRPSSSASISHKNNSKKLRPYKYQATNYYYGVAPTSDEEFTPLVRSRLPRRRKGSSHHASHFGSSCCRACFALVYILVGCVFSLCFLWILVAFYASPLTDVEVVGISNVLGTQKELIFNLQVRARNSNWWTIRMTNAAFSVFASSRFVPTTFLLLDSNTHQNGTMTVPTSDGNATILGADPAEFLGTIYHLEDPLIFQSGALFSPVVSTATSQIQIKNPGSTKDDNSGNERWSLLIRYPYELTVRGVLKYQILPYLPTLGQLHSVRVCKISSIDPITNKVSSDVTIPKQSICDDPSPVEGSVITQYR